MIIIMDAEASPDQIQNVIKRVNNQGFRSFPVLGTERSVVAVVGNNPMNYRDQFIRIPGVDRVVPISRPFKITSREGFSQNSTVRIKNALAGPENLTIIGGPCAVESRTQMIEIALAVKEAGANMLRGGAFKPRTSPYSFQGMGEEGLEILAEAGEITGLPVVTEVISPDLVDLVSEYADMLQIGARNMQNFPLLNKVGESSKPVLLKRGASATIDEFLLAAEYILSNGNHNVVLCERGIRTFETSTRNTTDINAIPVLKSLTHLPVFLDPSHSTGHWEYVAPVARAGVAAGADGLIVEVHHQPDQAMSDGGQSLKPEKFQALIKQTRMIAELMRETNNNGFHHTSPIEQEALLAGAKV